jgi:tetratricopeptide (TPR) repeat protein
MFDVQAHDFSATIASLPTGFGDAHVFPPENARSWYFEEGAPDVLKAIAMQSDAAEHLCEMFLFGPLTVLDARGVNRTPKAQKSRALLALLALAPRGSRSRVWLRDKLWSDRGEEQASASLRQALLDVRKSLGPLADKLLVADKHTVTLDLSRMQVDALDLLHQMSDRTSQTTFDAREVDGEILEGLDIGDPEFEDWLTLERQLWRSRFENAAAPRDLTPAREPLRPAPSQPVHGVAAKPADASNGAGTQASRPGWTVALTPPLVLGTPDNAGYLPQRLNELLAKLLLEGGDISVSDLGYRAAQTATTGSSGDSGTMGAVHLAVSTSYTFSPHEIHATINLHRVADQSLVWIDSATLDRRAVEGGDASQAFALTNQAIEEIRRWFTRQPAFKPDTTRETMFGAVNAMFRLSRPDLDAAESTLRTLIARNEAPQAYAWLAFLLTFRVGQRFSPDTLATIEEAQLLARRAVEIDGNNAVTLALVGHVHSYLFGEYDTASRLFERAIKINPAQVLGWDLYSMLHAYAGQPEKGLALANWGRHLGAYSPHRYYFDTSLCINAALAGQHDVAIAAGEQALFDRPDFNSLLRYLVSSYAHKNDMATARRLLDRLTVVEPDFSIGALIDARYPIIQTKGGSDLIAGLLKAGVKKN